MAFWKGLFFFFSGVGQGRQGNWTVLSPMLRRTDVQRFFFLSLPAGCYLSSPVVKQYTMG